MALYVFCLPVRLADWEEVLVLLPGGGLGTVDLPVLFSPKL